MTAHLIRQTAKAPNDRDADTGDATFHSTMIKLAFDKQKDPHEGFPLLEILVNDVSSKFSDPRLFAINPTSGVKRIFSLFRVVSKILTLKGLYQILPSRHV